MLLDKMAEAARKHTDRTWRLFKIKPEEFHRSENVFRVFAMEHVLRMQFGIKYDPLVKEVTKDGTPRISDDSTERFIHGVLSEKRTGTCSSLPTFSIAIGRRLGYPLKLVRVPIHTFFRWDDGTEVFNHQHSDSGGDILPDEHFHTWPKRWNADDFAMNARTKVWLHSLTPKQEVSKFLCNRAILLRECKRLEEALVAIKAAERFDPGNPACAELAFHIEQWEMPRTLLTSSQSAPLIKMPSFAMHIEAGGEQLLDTLDPFRDRAKDPKHLRVQVTTVT